MSTNNRMELYAVIAALTHLTPTKNIQVYSDSKYVVNGMNQWVRSWKKRNWQRDPPLKNVDLWKELDQLRTQKHQNVNFSKIKGHSGIYENELCDRLANEACSNPLNPPDPGFQLKFGQILYDHSRWTARR